MAKRNKSLKQILTVVITIAVLIGLAYYRNNIQVKDDATQNNTVSNYNSVQGVADYTNQAYVQINNNIPYFTEEEHITEKFEKYSNLDEYGRCGVAYANICKETMPQNGEKRGEISSVKPTGWNQAKYNGEYLYNRCHLIGYQLSDENANELNLITGTRYFNVTGMLPFEDEVANYVKENNDNVHVLYRVTPDFKDKNLVANGVEMEAYSVEDQGKGVCFNVYVYNVQPGVSIDYKTGESKTNQ